MDVPATIGLAFVASITPGPNNVMLWASGMNFGTRRTLPHIAGVNLGFVLLLFLVALGLGTVFEQLPALEVALRLAGSIYLLVLAARIFTTTGSGAASGAARPLTFLEAALFQWVNPKAWVMTTTAASTLMTGNAPLVVRALTMSGVFGLVNLPCISAWMASGAYAGRWVGNADRLTWLNRALGVLLGATVVLLVT